MSSFFYFIPFLLARYLTLFPMGCDTYTGGHVENTVEQLLQMGVTMKDSSDARPPTHRTAPPQTSRSAASAPSPAKTAAKKKWRTTLPDDFLVLPAESFADPEYQDAMLTQMLQDEMFIEELRNHPEFNEYLQQEREMMKAYARGEGRGEGREYEVRNTPSSRSAEERPKRSSGPEVSMMERFGKLGVRKLLILLHKRERHIYLQ